jgi:hypothetical protein
LFCSGSNAPACLAPTIPSKFGIAGKNILLLTHPMLRDILAPLKIFYQGTFSKGGKSEKQGRFISGSAA